jgi:ParB family transcriptional regulator, chromosome partitioning protein
MKSKVNQPYRQIKGLGLDALFGDTPTTGESVVGESVAIETIKLPQQQPRRYFDPQKLQQLVQSVKEHGILEPLLVRSLSEGVYELVAGERRYRAALEVGLTAVPVVVRQLSDEEALQLALIENLHREDLNPIEETEGILQLIALKLGQPTTAAIKILHRMQNEAEGKVTHNVMGNGEAQVVQDIFTGLGLMTWESFVKNRLPLLNLPQEVMEALQKGQLAYTKAQAIARVKDSESRQALLQAAIQEDLSLSQIKERIKADQKAPELPQLKKQMDATYRRFQKANFWEDPKKRSRLEALLEEMEALLIEE